MMVGWKDKKTPNPQRDLKSTQLDTRNQPSSTERSQGPSWKRPKDRAAKRAFWLQGTGKSATKRPPWFVPLIILIGAAGVFAFWLTLRAKTTDMLVFVGLNYASPWQPNSWAEEDADRFQSSFSREEALRCRNVVKKQTDFMAWENTLKTSLEKAQPGGPGGPRWWWKYKSLVVYVSAHGVVGSDGKPYLVFTTKDNAALIDKSGNCIEGAASFESFLQVLVDSRVDSRILLIVDLGRQLPDSRIPGVLLGIEDSKNNADFVEQAKGQVEKVSNSQLAVLFSADSQQISWPAPELDGTVFGTYVHHALKGLADTATTGNKDKVVTVGELHKYVQSAVKDYVRATRATVQEPQLVWGGGGAAESDFDLAFCEKVTQEPEEIRHDSQVVELDRLDKGWKRFSDWRDDHLRIDPWKVAQVRHKLCYAEQLAMGGKAYSGEASATLVAAIALMENSSRRQADIMGTSRFKGRPTNPVFNLPEPTPAPVVDPAKSDKPSATAAPIPAAPAEPPPPKTEAKPTYADRARTWLLTPGGIDGTRPVFNSENATSEEYLQFCWWWLSDSAHWTKESIEALDKIKPQLAAADISFENAILSQLLEDVRNVGALWDLNSSVNEQGPELLKWFDKLQIIYQQLELEPRVLLDDQAKQAIESLSQKLRVHRDCIHGRVQPTPMDSSELDQVMALIKTLTENWRSLDQCADEVPMIANQLVAIEQKLPDTVSELLGAYANLVSALRSKDQKLAGMLNAQRSAYKNTVTNLIASQKGSTTELTPGALRDAYLHLHRLPLDGSNRAELFRKVRAHFGSRTSNRKQAGTESRENVVSGFRVRLTAHTASTLASNIKIDNRNDGSQSASLWQQVVDNILESKGRLVAESELAGGKLAEHANMVRLLTNFTARREEEFDAARQQEMVAWQNYLLWRAGEFITDFWRTPSNRADEPYFATCAQAFLHAAGALDHVSRLPIDRVQATLDNRKQQAIAWAGLLRRDNSTGQSAESRQRIPLDTNGYPPGKARVWRKDFRVNGTDVSILPATSSGLSVGELGDISFDTVPGMNAKLFADYRGHSSERPLQSRDPKTLFTISQSLTPMPDTRVKVIAAPQPTEIIFALDCSGSFIEDFSEAKAALRTTLNELNGRPNLRIAFLIFGHSAKWVGKDGVPVVSQNNRIAQSLRSNDVSNDAAVLVPLANADLATTKSMLDYLEALEPFGNTPLYYAIIKSTQQLSPRNTPDLFRRIVVITDGVNQVYPRTTGNKEIRENIRLSDNSSPEQVAQAIAAHPNVQLDVLYLQTNDERPDPRLEEIVQKSGGRYIVHTQAKQLSEALKDAIEPLRHTVRHVEQLQQGDFGDYRRFGTETPLSLEASHEAFEVSVVKKQPASNLSVPTYTPVVKREFTAFVGDRIIIEYDRKSQFLFPFAEPSKSPLTLSGANIRAWRWHPRDNALEVRFLIDRADSRSRVDQTLRPEWSFVEIGLNPKKPEARLWSPDVTWEMELNRPIGRVEFDGKFRGFAGDGGESVLPARFWVCTDPGGPKMHYELELKAVNFDKWHEMGHSQIRMKLEQLPENMTAIDVTVLPPRVKSPTEDVSSERWLARPPVADSVEHKFIEDGSIVFRYRYHNRKPAGSIKFYRAPAESDTNWSHSDWVSTEL